MGVLQRLLHPTFSSDLSAWQENLLFGEQDVAGNASAIGERLCEPVLTAILTSGAPPRCEAAFAPARVGSPETSQTRAPTDSSATTAMSHPIPPSDSSEVTCPVKRRMTKKTSSSVPMSVEPGSESATSVSLSCSNGNATDLPVDEPEASRVRVQDVMVDRKVLDLFNVHESPEKDTHEHAQWELEPDEQNAENYDGEKQAEIAGLLKV